MSSAEERRKQVMLGDLPPSFLTVGADSREAQIAADAQVAQAMQFQRGGNVPFPTQNMRCLSVTIAQARLTKNYGIVKMDPYCRVRVGTSVIETPTCAGGGKSPKWNKAFRCFIPEGVDSVYLEIMDEKAFTTDDRVAWAHIQIPQHVFSGETDDEWHVLSGKQGENKEGSIQLIMSYSDQPMPVYPQPQVVMVPGVPNYYYPPQMAPMPVNPQYPQMPPHQQQHPGQQQQQQPRRPMYTEEDINQIHDMFPDSDKEVIKSVLEANRGNKDATINNLLSMQS